MGKHGWTEDEPGFHIEKHIPGRVYGTKAVLMKLEQQLQELYHKSGQQAADNKMSAFEVIRAQLLFCRDVSFDTDLFAALTKEEKREADRLLLRRILEHDPTCYPYTGCLDSVKGLDRAFLATLTGTDRYEVLAGIYRVNRNGRALRELTAAALHEIYCFDLLAHIYQKTEEKRVLKRILRVYAQKREELAYSFVMETRKIPPVK